MKISIAKALAVAAVLTIAAFGSATQLRAEVVSPASNTPVPGRAHTNIEIYVPDNGAKIPLPPSFQKPQAPATDQAPAGQSAPGSKGDGKQHPATVSPELQNAKPMPIPQAK